VRIIQFEFGLSLDTKELASIQEEREMKEASGTLLYRQNEGAWEILLVHPSGNYNKKAPWSIPKGIPEPYETLEETARRETWEETGVRPAELTPIGHIQYKKSPKRVHCFIGAAPANASPSCTSWEVDQSVFVPIEKARELIHPDQLAFIERLKSVLDPC
jgi:predicted NUDIX family NTP pyrophosphohydrolase